MAEVQLGALVLGIVQFLKYYGMPKKLCPAISLIVAVALCLGDAYLRGTLAPETLVTAITQGLAIGAATTGAVGVAKELAKKV